MKVLGEGADFKGEAREVQDESETSCSRKQEKAQRTMGTY